MRFLQTRSKAKQQYLFLMVLFSLGLSSNLVWCNFIGHSGGFSSSAFEFSYLVNVRVFWLGGISLFCILLVIFPGQVRHFDKNLKFVVPVLASSATGFFAFAYSQSFFDPMILTVIGLTLAGMAYAWTSARYNLLIVRVLGVRAVAWSTMGALSLMLMASSLTPLIHDTGILVLIAMVLPILAASLFEVSRKYLMRSNFNSDEDESSTACRPSRTVFEIKPKTRVFVKSPISKTSYYIFLIAVALLLAMVRSLGAYGVWQGTEIATTASFAFSFPSVVIMVVLLVVFAYFAIIRMEGHSIGIRFMPPIMVIFAGLFMAVVQIGSTNFSSQIYNYSLLEADVCSHLLFWYVVGASMERLAVPSFRVIGIAGSIYGIASVIWVVLLGNTDFVDHSFVAIMTYGLLVVVLYGLWMLLKQTEKNVPGEDGFTSRGITGKKDSGIAVDDPTETLIMRCETIAKEYKLSPRETDVFILLAQGRTRKFIGDELVLSDNTVKTHLTHIYSKMNISNRQQMLSLLWGNSEVSHE